METVDGKHLSKATIIPLYFMFNNIKQETGAIRQLKMKYYINQRRKRLYKVRSNLRRDSWRIVWLRQVLKDGQDFKSW